MLGAENEVSGVGSAGEPEKNFIFDGFLFNFGMERGFRFRNDFAFGFGRGSVESSMSGLRGPSGNAY